jgi:hypothetical protein
MLGSGALDVLEVRPFALQRSFMLCVRAKPGARI